MSVSWSAHNRGGLDHLHESCFNVIVHCYKFYCIHSASVFTDYVMQLCVLVCFELS